MKSRDRKSKRREEKKKEDQGRERVRRQKMQAREKVAKSRNAVFPMIFGSGGSKNRLAKAAGAEPSGQMRNEKLHAVALANHMSKSRCTKHTMLGPLLELQPPLHYTTLHYSTLQYTTLHYTTPHYTTTTTTLHLH